MLSGVSSSVAMASSWAVGGWLELTLKMYAEPEALTRVAPLLVQHGVGLLELTADVFDLRAYYRERVSAERLKRSGVGVVEEIGRPGESPGGVRGQGGPS
jgi:hypothetical protein